MAKYTEKWGGLRIPSTLGHNSHTPLPFIHRHSTLSTLWLRMNEKRNHAMSYTSVKCTARKKKDSCYKRGTLASRLWHHFWLLERCVGIIVVSFLGTLTKGLVDNADEKQVAWSLFTRQHSGIAWVTLALSPGSLEPWLVRLLYDDRKSIATGKMKALKCLMLGSSSLHIAFMITLT